MRSGTVENLHDFKGKLDKIKELKIFKKIYAVTLDKCVTYFKSIKILLFKRIYVKIKKANLGLKKNRTKWA